MSRIRSIATGLIAGGVSVLAIWVSRVVLPPREPRLPEVIQLDTLEAYKKRPSAGAVGIVSDSVLQHVVDQFEIPLMPRVDAVKRLAAISGINIITDRLGDSSEVAIRMKDSVAPMSIQHATVDQLLERIWRDPPNDISPVGWFERDGMILMSMEYDYEGARTVLRIYDVRDLMLRSNQISRPFPITTQPSTDKYDAILHGSEQEADERLIAAVGCGDGSEARAWYFAGKLLIQASRDIHRHVAERLALLRSGDE